MSRQLAASHLESPYPRRVGSPHLPPGTPRPRGHHHRGDHVAGRSRSSHCPCTDRSSPPGPSRGGPLDDDLPCLVAAGSPDAIRRAYEAHGLLVYNLCRHALDHPQHAEDALRKVFLRERRSRGDYDPSRPPVRWLTEIAERMHLSMEAVRWHLSRGLVALRRAGELTD